MAIIWKLLTNEKLLDFISKYCIANSVSPTGFSLIWPTNLQCEIADVI